VSLLGNGMPATLSPFPATGYGSPSSGRLRVSVALGERIGFAFPVGLSRGQGQAVLPWFAEQRSIVFDPNALQKAK
jgi:hypothetical protein